MTPDDQRTKPSKLFIRSEVLAVIEYLDGPEDHSKADQTKAMQRLSRIDDRAAVLSILVKELQRARTEYRLRTIGELLMELGSLKTLRDPLWTLIQDPQADDDTKDVANLVLRQLGDDTDPERYLDYLQDPEALISRETSRMLSVSAENPEALVDFLDFIFALPPSEQVNLLDSLLEDFPAGELMSLLVPALESEPPRPVQKALLKCLTQTKTHEAARYLSDRIERMAKLPVTDPDWTAAWKRSLHRLRLSGCTPEAAQPATVHPLCTVTTPDRGFATLPDGLGNQGLLFCRRYEHGDLTVMSLAVNDQLGVLGGFGFYQVGEEDFERLIERFHEDATQVTVSLGYIRQKLLDARHTNEARGIGVPYEVTCWGVLLDDVPPESPAAERLARCAHWARDGWAHETGALYDCPDFATWFVEETDQTLFSGLLQEAEHQLVRGIQARQDTQALVDITQRLADQLARQVSQGPWRMVLAHRLADVAVLLETLPTHTRWRDLAATEALHLSQSELPTPFLRRYAHQCLQQLVQRLTESGMDTTGILATLKDALAVQY